MTVQDVTKFHRRHLWGRCMHACAYVCVCMVSHRISSSRRVGTRSSVLTWKGCIAHNN